MTALLIRRRRPIDEPVPSAGRVIHALADLGLEFDAVEQLALEPDLARGDVDAMHIGKHFDVVILGSHLVNVPDAGLRAAFLRLARRHLGPGGSVLVEHHPLDWAETAADVPPAPGGSDLGMVEVLRDPPFVSAVSVYDVDGRVVRQPFRARVLSEAELDGALAAAGLRRTARLAPTWLRASADER